jgi:hypothetical protein
MSLVTIYLCLAAAILAEVIATTAPPLELRDIERRLRGELRTIAPAVRCRSLPGATSDLAELGGMTHRLTVGLLLIIWN